VSAAIEALEPGDLHDLFGRLRAAFEEHRDEIDALNVFPVPDGDTGTNLFLTVRAALGSGDSADDERLPDALARGATLGARGNSGVIFSQVVRALSDVLTDRGHLDHEGLVEALVRGRDRAYEAVARPVEGTMLTAIRVAAETAHEVVHEDGVNGLGHVSAVVRVAVSGAVQRTTDQLDVLRDAGVVDAGARGFEVFCDVLDRFVRGDDAPTPVPAGPVVRREGPVAEREAGSLEFRYEVQYLLDAPADEQAALRAQLDRIGDSVVVVDAGDVLSVHVHTNDIGAAIEAGLEHGRPSRIEVTSFADQISQHGETEEPDQPDQPAEPPPSGCVAVLPGESLRSLAREHGAVALAGAAGSLPSVADLLNAIGEVEGQTVLVLPGHRNAVPTAHQAAEVSAAEGGRRIVVVDDATSPPRIIAALAVWDREQEPDEVAALMGEAAADVTSGEVVAAVRDADTPAGPVREGQWLAVRDGTVVGVHDDVLDTLEQLARACGCAEAEIVTLIVGDGVDSQERERAVEVVDTLAEIGDVEVVEGGQRPARYHLGIE
jgi:uncharacterized protein